MSEENRQHWLDMAAEMETNHLRDIADDIKNGDPLSHRLLRELTFYMMVGINRGQAPWGDEIRPMHQKSADRFAELLDACIADWMGRRH